MELKKRIDASIYVSLVSWLITQKLQDENPNLETDPAPI
jgi:hypothetical protein